MTRRRMERGRRGRRTAAAAPAPRAAWLLAPRSPIEPSTVRARGKQARPGVSFSNARQSSLEIGRGGVKPVGGGFALFNRVVVIAAVAASIVIIAAWVLSDPWYWIAMDYRTFFVSARIPDAALYNGPNYTFIYPPTVIAPLRLFSVAAFWP